MGEHLALRGVGADRSTITLTDSVVRDSRTDSGGTFGRGANIQNGATATFRRTLIDHIDVDSIAEGLERAVADAERLVALGRARSGELSWDATVDSTVAAYREALEDAS